MLAFYKSQRFGATKLVSETENIEAALVGKSTQGGSNPDSVENGQDGEQTNETWIAIKK